MLHIGICDSNPMHRTQLHKVLSVLLFDTVELHVTEYPTGQELLAAVRQGQAQLDLLFLEIALADTNGLRVASALRSASCRFDIIFLTELERYVYDGYIYHAYDYLIKPISAKKIGTSVRRYISERLGNKEKYLTISAKGGARRLNLSRVRYFETRQRKIAAMHEEETVEFYQKMGELYEVVRAAGFLRCHQSYVVNAAQVTALQGHELRLEDGTCLPVSKRYLPEVREYFTNLMACAEEAL